MLTDYLRSALHQARYELLEDDAGYYGEIPPCPGVYASASSLEDCRELLAQVLEDWVLLRIHKNLPLPVIEGIELRIQEVA